MLFAINKITGKHAALLLAALVLVLSACPQDADENGVQPEWPPVGDDWMLRSLRIAGSNVALAQYGETPAYAAEGFVTISGPWSDGVIRNLGSASTPGFVPWAIAGARITFTVGAPTNFTANHPANLSNGNTLWVRVAANGEDEDIVQYYRIRVTVTHVPPSFGAPDSAWLSDPYNPRFRVFPNAPANGILTREYFDANHAPPSHWNAQGHNHRFPDPFRFANGNAVRNLADWESRRREISYILQYYMHGWKPSLAPNVVNIEWEDTSPTATAITVTHIESGRSFSFTVNHTPPEGARDGFRERVLLFGVGFPATGRDSAWGTAGFSIGWAAGTGFMAGMGGGADRAGNVTTLFGLAANDPGTPSSMMSSAWVMSVILTVVEQGGFRGLYDPQRVGIYGFSFMGKHAMIIGAFAQGQGGTQIAYTFVGSAGSGGPAVDRFIPTVAYRNFEVDSLPDVPLGAAGTALGANSHSRLSSITWFQQRADDERILPPSWGDTPNRRMVRGWTADTPGIPAGSLIYNEEYVWALTPFSLPYDVSAENPSLRGGHGGIQVLAQARNENAVWFSQRFQQLQDLHSGLGMDTRPGGPGSDPGGILCTMPFDSHFISALIAPRLIVYSEGFHPIRNNPEGQWANWLMTDEIYQMFAEELNDPSIIWRNTIRMYHISHTRQPWQNEDDALLVNTLHSGAIPPVRFRTPPFPVDDPRYRWDFNRMDWGRPGQPTIAERVRRMRESPVRVRAMDDRGLLEHPEPL